MNKNHWGYEDGGVLHLLKPASDAGLHQQQMQRCIIQKVPAFSYVRRSPASLRHPASPYSHKSTRMDGAESSSDSELESPLGDYALGERALGREERVNSVALSRDGSIRRVRRNDYSRSGRELTRPRESV